LKSSPTKEEKLPETFNSMGYHLAAESEKHENTWPKVPDNMIYPDPFSQQNGMSYSQKVMR